MSSKSLIETLQKILLLHKSLNQLAMQKTEIIKTGDTNALNSLLKEEKKHIQAIQKLETDRQAISKDFLAKFNFEINMPTISDCIDFANDSEKQRLMKIKSDLQTEIRSLSNRNELNQQLLKQSLLFVNMSLDLLMPNIDAFNYERPGQTQQHYEEGRSIFNTKA